VGEYLKGFEAAMGINPIPRDKEYEQTTATIEAATKMEGLLLAFGHDKEKLHFEMDELLCDTLDDLGYGRMVGIFRSASVGQCRGGK
jgi:hypothetical protein